MQRKKMPLLSALSSLPLLKHWSCNRKSAYLPSVCRSPGPSLTFSSSLLLTVNFDFLPGNSFQPSRFLPLKIALAPRGTRVTLRSSRLTPLATVNTSGAGPASVRLPPLAPPARALFMENLYWPSATISLAVAQIGFFTLGKVIPKLLPAKLSCASSCLSAPVTLHWNSSANWWNAVVFSNLPPPSKRRTPSLTVSLSAGVAVQPKVVSPSKSRSQPSA